MGLRRRIYERWYLQRRLRQLTFQHEYQRQETRDRINGIALIAAHEMARVVAAHRGGPDPGPSASPAGGDPRGGPPARPGDYIDGEASEVP